MPLRRRPKLPRLSGRRLEFTHMENSLIESKQEATERLMFEHHVNHLKSLLEEKDFRLELKR